MPNLMKHLNVDVHGITRDRIEEYMDRLLILTPKEVEDICIVHGYHQGHVLRDFIRFAYTHERIEEIQTYENGRTVLRLIH